MNNARNTVALTALPADSITIRPAQLADIPTIHSIYAHHVLHGTATFEEVVPSVDEMQKRFLNITQSNYPYIVAEREGEVLGYAYLASYRSRSAFRYTVEDSIYLHKDSKGLGLGSLLLARLIELAEQGPWRLIVAVIGDSENMGSIKLHEKFGFKLTGTEPGTGYKFNRWIDTVLMHKPIDLGNTAPIAAPVQE